MSEKIAVGDVCIATGPNVRELVLVLAIKEKDQAAEVCLATLDVEEATDADLVLPPALTGMPMEIAFESDVTGMVWSSQLGEPTGQVGAEFVKALRDLACGQPLGELRRYQGMPLLGRLDPRWSRKEREALTMQELARDCATRLLEQA